MPPTQMILPIRQLTVMMKKNCLNFSFKPLINTDNHHQRGARRAYPNKLKNHNKHHHHQQQLHQNPNPPQSPKPNQKLRAPILTTIGSTYHDHSERMKDSEMVSRSETRNNVSQIPRTTPKAIASKTKVTQTL